MTKPDTCTLIGCDETPTCGPWCQMHYDQQTQRRVDILLQTAGGERNLAELVVVAERRLEFLSDTLSCQPQFGSCCGHMMQVHTHGGCTGLSGGGQGFMGQDGWYPCRCQAWEPHDG